MRRIAFSGRRVSLPDQLRLQSNQLLRLGVVLIALLHFVLLDEIRGSFASLDEIKVQVRPNEILTIITLQSLIHELRKEKLIIRRTQF